MLPAILSKEKHSALDPIVQKEYKEQDDGSFILDVGPVRADENTFFALENVGGLKKTLADYKARNTTKAEQLKKFEGIEDPEAALAALAKLDELGDVSNLDDKVAEKVELIKQQLEQKTAKLIEKLTKEKDTSAATVSRVRQLREKDYLRAEAARAFAKHKVIPEFAEVLMAKVVAEATCKTGEDEALSIQINDLAGNARISNAVNSTENMTLDELVGEYRGNDSLAVCFEGSGASGVGAKGSDGLKGGTGKVVLSVQDQGNPAKYRAAKAEAEKRGVELVLAEN